MEALEDLEESLQRFAGYMGECFSIPKVDLDLIKDTKFIQLRGQIIEQSCLYFKVVVPECVSVMSDLGNFYQDFNDFYVDYETMCENIDLINESTKEINIGLIRLEQIHAPVFKQTELDGKQVKKVMDEIYAVDKNLKQEYDEIKQ